MLCAEKLIAVKLKEAGELRFASPDHRPWWRRLRGARDNRETSRTMVWLPYFPDFRLPILGLLVTFRRRGSQQARLPLGGPAREAGEPQRRRRSRGDRVLDGGLRHQPG
jgi:hypothetical protein